MIVTSSTQTQYTQATNKTTATKATSAYESVAPTSAQQTDKMAEMKEKYKDVYTPIPETYSKADEELQTSKVKEAYPNYMTGPEFLKLVDQFYDELGGEKIEFGQTPTQDQIDKQKIAFEKAYELFGGEKEFTAMQKDVQAIQTEYPFNTLAKKGVSNAKEITRFTNAAIYEGLESGKTLGEAKWNAIFIRSSFLDMGFERHEFAVSIGQPDATYEPEPIVFGPDHSLWDLRKYGIEGKWEDNKVYESDDAMIAELNKKIGQFNFMLNNKGLIENAENELAASSRGRLKSYQSEILNERLPKVQMALDIFKNYKIYDSIDVRG